ncbi:hypothetical protein J7K74_01115, partial [Candidatus Woesearchaeota archaeon]|nr:hypothetical protein [Candidatus Woesearchaeota archaeon]
MAYIIFNPPREKKIHPVIPLYHDPKLEETLENMEKEGKEWKQTRKGILGLGRKNNIYTPQKRKTKKIRKQLEKIILGGTILLGTIGITQAKTITIHFKVYNDQILNHTAQTGIITPDTTQAYPEARIIFQELDTIQERYINIAEATTNNNGEATITAEITPINENPNTPRQTLE